MRSLLSATVAATLATSAALAQTEPARSGALEKVVVTAQRRTESLQRVPVAVSAYKDEVIIPRQNANNYTLFDVERVEVLRGPQGTTFGGNSTGGAISIVTRKPGKELGGYLTLGMGSYDSRLARGSVDVPLGERVLTKFSGFFLEDDGWLKNRTNGEDLNGLSNWGLRAAVRFLPSESVTWDPTAEYIVAEGEYLRSNVGDRDTTNTVYTMKGATFDVVADMLAKRGLRNDTAGLGLISNIEWRVSDDRTFNSITGYRSVDREFVLDFSLARLNTTPGPFGLNNDGEYDMISQEFKFTGALGYSSWRDIGNTTTTYALYAQVDWQLADRFTAILGARYTAETKEVDLRPTQYGGMTTADLREAGIDTDLDTSIVTPRLGLNFQASDDVMIYASATRGFKAGGWNSRTAYRPQEFQPIDPEKTWSYEAGFKSEFLENRLRVNATVFYAETDDLQSSCTTPGPIAGTTLSTQNNAGDMDVKGVEFEFAAQLTDDLYVYGSAGFQDGEYSSTNPEAGSFCTNGGTVVDGACANPVPPATSTSYTNAIDPDDELSRLPERTFALGVNRDFPVAATGGKLRFTAEANYNSGYWTTASNATPTLRLIPGGPLVTPNALDTYADSYSLLNLSIGYESDGGRWRALIECKKCSDEEYLSSIFNGEFYGQPRRVNGSVTFSFWS